MKIVPVNATTQFRLREAKTVTGNPVLAIERWHQGWLTQNFHPTEDRIAIPLDGVQALAAALAEFSPETKKKPTKG